MINSIVSYDDNDELLGDFFEKSFKWLNDLFIPCEKINLIPICGLDCSEEHVKISIESFSQQNFVFVGLTHGNEKQLLTDNGLLVEISNIQHFNGSLFYSPACDTGIKLGIELINKGCKSYVGCIQETFSTYEDYWHIYIKCENHCLVKFLSTDESIETCFNDMMDYFDKCIDNLSKVNDEILVAMELVNNKDSFILLGEKELKSSMMDS